MPELIPVSEAIVRALCDLLRTIRTDAGAFNNDVIVERYKPDSNAKGVDDATLLIVVHEGAPVDVTGEGGVPGTWSGFKMRIDLFCTPLNAAEFDATDDGATAKFIAMAYADVRAAIKVDCHLGGLAFYAVTGPPSDAQEGDLPTLNIPVEVFYLTKQDDPFTSQRDA